MRFKLIFSEKMILCSGDTAALYKLADICLQHGAIFDKSYVTRIDELYAGTM